MEEAEFRDVRDFGRVQVPICDECLAEVSPANNGDYECPNCGIIPEELVR